MTECINHWANVHGGVENYTALLDHIEQWRVRTHGRVILVTFNYDTMIERALTGRGISTKNLDGYISDDRYKLIKVHGSVNWARDVTAPTGLAYNAESLIQAAPRLQFGTWWIAPQYPVAYIQKPGVGNVPAVPAIALPLQSKRAFECPGQHLDVLKDHLPEVSRCLIIGWRGNEPHFTSLLLDGLKPGVQWLISVGHRRDGSEVVQRLQNLGLPGKFSDSDLSFSDFIVRRETYKFLSD